MVQQDRPVHRASRAQEAKRDPLWRVLPAPEVLRVPPVNKAKSAQEVGREPLQLDQRA
jgi:hypothetical protein